jgi:hypothetical protein
MADPHAQHGHDHADDDHPGYTLPANIAAIVAIPTMIFGLAFTCGLWGPKRDLLLFILIVAACVIALGAIGIIWASMVERRFGTGIFAIVLGVVTLVGTGWAYDESGDACPAGETRNTLVCVGGTGGGGGEAGGGETGGEQTAPGEGSQVGTSAPSEPTESQPSPEGQPTGGGAESGAPGGEG